MSTSPVYRVALIGTGRKGFGHARGYEGNPRTEIAAAADPDADNLALFQQRWDVPGYADYHELLAREAIDIAAPILPVRHNPQVVLDCAAAGVKAIYCEKPMAASLAEADAMVAACASGGIAFAAGDAYRNMGPHWKVRAAIEVGELGEVTSINLYQATDEVSGGGCQGLSVMRMFAFDAEVEWISGWVAGDPASDDDQNMGGVVRFANGVSAFVHNRPAAHKGIEVVCTEGVYRSDWGGGNVWKAGAAGLEEIAGFFDEFGGVSGWMEPSGTRQRYGIQAIVDAIDHGTEPLCSGANMRQVLEISIALRESHRQGHAAVRLPLADRSLRIDPVPARMENKKGVMDRDTYTAQITAASQAELGGARVA